MAVLRRRRDPPDPLAHVRADGAPARWQGAVVRALEHRRRFAEMRSLSPAGPSRERLDGLARRVDAGVLAVWDLVQRAAVAERVLETIDPTTAMDRVKDARRRLADAQGRGDDTAALAHEVELHAGRHAAAQRVWNEVEDLGSRLDALDLRLGTVVAHAGELAAGAAGTPSLDLAVGDLDTAIDQLAATRAALAELEDEQP